MSPLAQSTDFDHGGGVFEEVTADHVGSPERLNLSLDIALLLREDKYLMEVTCHPLATADLHIREPRKPLPPATTSLFFVACAIFDPVSLLMCI